MSSAPWLPNYMQPDNYFWGWIDVSIMIAENILTTAADVALLVWWFDRNRKVRRANEFERFLVVHRVPPSVIPGFDRKHPKGIMQESCDWMDSGETPREVFFRVQAYKQYRATYLKGWTPGHPKPEGAPSFERYLQGMTNKNWVKPRKTESGYGSTGSYAPSPAVGASNDEIMRSAQLG